MATEKLTTVHGHGEVRRLQTQAIIRAPIEAVWRALTDIQHVKRWWADGSIGDNVGDSVQLGGAEDLNGTILIKMAPHVFAFTWHDEPSKATRPEWIETSTNSLVHFDLIETAAETTLLTLVQFAPVEGATGAAAGWHELFERIKSYVEKGKVESGAGRFDALKELYAEAAG